MFKQTPAANVQPAVEEGDQSASLFRDGFVFGEPVLPIEQHPGESVVPDVPRGEPANPWYALPPASTPSPIASTRNLGADDSWKFWPAGQSSISMTLPSGATIRAVWLPVIPTPISFLLTYAAGAQMYQATYSGGETVPIPSGAEVVTLSVASSAIVKPDIWVYITHDKLPPFKVSGGTPITPQNNIYDQLLLGFGPVHYWPCNDPAGSLTAADYGPSPAPLAIEGGATLGNNPLTTDGATSAFSPGTFGSFLNIPAAIPNPGAWSVCFWFRLAQVPAGASSGTGYPFYNGNGNGATANNPAFGAIFNASSLFDWATDSNTGVFPSDLGILADGKIHFIVLSGINSGTGELWIDGVLIASPSGYTVANGSPGQFLDPGGSMQVLGAKLAYFAFQLSSTQIGALYQAGL